MKTLIITGGTIHFDFFNNFLKDNSFDYTMVVDGALDIIKDSQVKVDLIIGDLDTVDENLVLQFRDKGVEVIQFSPDKDYSDTHLALIKALELNASDITIVGGIGTRMDHTLANIHTLMIPTEKNIPCRIVNENNIIQCTNNTLALENTFGEYISLIPLTTEVSGISSKGLKYSLDNDKLVIGASIGISNEIIDKNAFITIKEGILIVIQSKD
ncbi:thiamine pyrophosphokinase [Natranaerovirga pectinivora]|uniref:Thiamine diphosphokinase n=1 Tax=Natranaerovirga pectinivora TaxID=682400 RepID=A0A4R3MP04_9FIRM|nr:thiamine diphosphokinase [Natranaerovirga pectinivora]TCT16951.1 thiamine pyrophosphokinase [Natranaerovirga pectinivora]